MGTRVEPDRVRRGRTPMHHDRIIPVSAKSPVSTTSSRWIPGDKVSVEGMDVSLEIFPGLFWHGADGRGVYFGRDGTVSNCDRLEAFRLARIDRIILTCCDSLEYGRLG
jgi:hypothetical protein